MKKLLVLVLTMAVAGSAFAVVDGDVNSVGFYSDLTADTVEILGAAPYSTNAVYVVLTSANFDALYGFEFGYDLVGEAMVLSTTHDNPQALDVGSAGNHIVGFGGPTMTSEATLLTTLSVMYMDTTGAPVTFTLTGTDPSSDNPLLPALLLAEGVILSSGDSTDIGNINFQIVGMGGVAEDIVATDIRSFDSVKSLYR